MSILVKKKITKTRIIVKSIIHSSLRSESKMHVVFRKNKNKNLKIFTINNSLIIFKNVL